jgi:hypothetical protein
MYQYRYLVTESNLFFISLSSRLGSGELDVKWANSAADSIY